jgi:2-dehydropantoate 2-reductase
MANSFQHILVYGIGGVGGYFGGLLAHGINGGPAGGTQVHFIARGEHLRAIQEKGLILKTADGQTLRCIPNTASDDPTPLPMVDLVLLCVKGYDLSGALHAIRDKVTPSTVILPLMNGADVADRVRGQLDRGIILPTCVYVSSRITAPGEVTQMGPAGRILTGNRTGRRDLYPEDLLMLALKAGWNVEWLEKPEEAVWKKYLFIAPFALVTASRDLTIGGVLKDPEARKELLAVMDEVMAVSASRGVLLSEEVRETTLQTAAAFPEETKTSFQRDVESGRGRNERDLLGDTLVRFGREEGIPTPVIEKILDKLEK